jgi:chitinase
VIPGAVVVDEGDRGTRTASVPVELSRRSSERVTVEWETIVVQADHDDVVAASGTVTFEPGQTRASATVQVVGDRLDELDEYAVLRFHDPVGAQLGGFWGLGLVQILDDDPPPRAIPLLGIGHEGDRPGSPLRIPILLSAPSGREVTVGWRTEDGTARAPGDYAAASGTVTFAPGETWAEIVIDLAADQRREPPEVLLLRLGDAAGADLLVTTGVGLVLDDD